MRVFHLSHVALRCWGSFIYFSLSLSPPIAISGRLIYLSIIYLSRLVWTVCNTVRRILRFTIDRSKNTDRGEGERERERERYRWARLIHLKTPYCPVSSGCFALSSQRFCLMSFSTASPILRECDCIRMKWMWSQLQSHSRLGPLLSASTCIASASEVSFGLTVTYSMDMEEWVENQSATTMLPRCLSAPPLIGIFTAFPNLNC